jgi:hypothetical protein
MGATIIIIVLLILLKLSFDISENPELSFSELLELYKNRIKNLFKKDE